MDGPEPTTTAKAAIDIFVLLTINHSLGSAERERASAWVLLFDGQGPAGMVAG
jgi:xanthine/CO dehydrogenase XdhC/CoxF family maturation factor